MTTEVCAHHWMLVPDLTRDVPAECLRCGETRTFEGFKEYGEQEMWRAAMTAGRARRVGIKLPGSPPLREGEFAS